jgi:hypothetical protein
MGGVYSTYDLIYNTDPVLSDGHPESDRHVDRGVETALTSAIEFGAEELG